MIIIVPIGSYRLIARRVRSGQCRVCGCTQERGCAAGCAWVDAARTLCSRCLWNMAVLAFAMRK